MCFSGDGGAEEIAQAQRADEVARQARIAAGTASINGIFDGTKKGTDAAASYDPTQHYFNADGTAYDPGATSQAAAGAGPPGNWRAPAAWASITHGAAMSPADLIKAGQLFTKSIQATPGFDDTFYKRRADAYTNYATPELDRQYGQAKDAMVYALDRSGLDQSSAGNLEAANLANTDAKSRLQIASTAQDTSNAARASVESARSNLITQLNATGDSSAAAAGAIRQAQALNAPVGITPLGSLFSGFTQDLAAVGSNSRNQYAGFFGSPYSTPSASGSASSSMVVK